MNRVEKILQIEDSGSEDKTNSPRNREYTFTFRWVAPRGHVYDGPFTNRILDQGQKTEASALAAKLRDGMPFESVEPYRARLQEELAWMTVSLIDKPDWASNLASIIDDDVLVLLWKEVDNHEEIFRRPPEAKEGSAPNAGSQAGGADSEKVVVE
jgi:hypothetical protein